jgi:hypothetical protein
VCELVINYEQCGVKTRKQLVTELMIFKQIHTVVALIKAYINVTQSHQDVLVGYSTTIHQLKLLLN